MLAIVVCVAKFVYLTYTRLQLPCLEIEFSVYLAVLEAFPISSISMLDLRILLITPKTLLSISFQLGINQYLKHCVKRV